MHVGKQNSWTEAGRRGVSNTSGREEVFRGGEVVLDSSLFTKLRSGGEIFMPIDRDHRCACGQLCRSLEDMHDDLSRPLRQFRRASAERKTTVETYRNRC